MDTLELEDIQGYIIRGYANMNYSKYCFLRVTDSIKAKKWLNDIVDDLTISTHIINKADLPSTNLNIAFTATGLIALGLVSENVTAFSREFREGMLTEHRRRMLGDVGASKAEDWVWGGPNTDQVHICLLVFGKDKETCENYYTSLEKVFTNSGIGVVKNIDGQTLPNNKEHFGFRDGISQPTIIGSGKTSEPTNRIKAGEFILGYPNEYNVLPDTPLINKEQGNLNLLNADMGGTGKKDLGRNGSYLVIRQMEQDVTGFWNFMNEKTKNEDGSININESNKLAAKIMGRWPSGAPVTKFPDVDPGGISDDNDFGYAKEDKDGAKCPFGSHLRRCNPRDSLEDNTPKESIKLSNRHRIIRRARLYGDPFVGSPTNTNPNGEVGILFNCFNADISRQFELVQFTWANSTKIKNLYNDPDPIIGTNEISHNGLPQNFTIQGCPFNKTVTDLKRFVKIKGGAYFFFPSISSIRYLASL
jgi:Dyp-type peroxidase family